MNAYQLLMPDGKDSGIWVCSTCRVVYSERHGGKSEAESCCMCRYCGKPALRDDKDCYTRMHEACWEADVRERYGKRLEAAEEVTAYDGWVYVDGVGPQDGYFASAEEAEEYIWDTHEDGDALPQWAFCCTPSKPARLDTEDITQRWVDNGYEDIEYDLVGMDQLRDALDVFWEANKHLFSWNVDYSRKVRLHWEEAP